VTGAAPFSERRRSPRRIPARDESLGRVRLRTGRELDVVDLSNTGALVEGTARLLPNTHLDVHLVTRAGRVLVRCRVVRAAVCHLEADVIRYRSALAFERAIDTSAGYCLPGDFPSVGAAAGTPYPISTGEETAAPAVRLSA
jgi:hypothetical protein